MLDAVTDDAARGFVHGEWHEATHGLYRLLDCPWMNPPDSNDAASRKALQLQVASRLGLRVPDTMMTSDRGEAMAFVERLGLEHVVYKIFSATYQVWRETRRLGADDLPMLDSLRLAPVIFQELIPAVADLRVTIVGDQVFAMAIDTSGTSYDVDFRISLAQARTSAATLPPDVEDVAARPDGRARAGVRRRGPAAHAGGRVRLPRGEPGRGVPVLRARVGAADHGRGRRLAGGAGGVLGDAADPDDDVGRRV